MYVIGNDQEDMMGINRDWASTIRNLLDAAEAHDRTAERDLAKGDHEHSEDNRKAAASFRAKAEKIMVQYRIDEEEALAQGAGDEPILQEIRVTTGGSRLSHYYQMTFGVIARHCGVRVTYNWDNGYVATVVGYPGDVRYVEFLWTSALLMYVTRIDPRWDDTLPEEENIWRMRNAGIQRRVIADRAWGNGREAAARSKVQRVYLAECKRRGEVARATGLGHQAETYQAAYAEAFHDTLAYRLRAARDAADSVSGGLVLHGRAERVDEAFYGHFPHLRPKPATPAPAGTGAPCPKCAKAKSGHCRDHPAYTITKVDRARWDRMENSPSALAGRAGGRAAAEGVVLVRDHTPAQRIERSGGAIEG